MKKSEILKTYEAWYQKKKQTLLDKPLQAIKNFNMDYSFLFQKVEGILSSSPTPSIFIQRLLKYRQTSLDLWSLEDLANESILNEFMTIASAMITPKTVWEENEGS